MAKKDRQSEITRSQRIRDYLKPQPEAMPKDIKAAMKEQGVEVSIALVNAVKASEKRRKMGKTPARRGKSGESAMTATDLMHAKALADRLGGVERAQVALETLKKLR